MNALAGILEPHPSSPRLGVRSLCAEVAWRGTALRFRFELWADTATLRLPERCSSAFTDGLWQTTCFEAFLAYDGGDEYREVNLSPSTAWAVYAFAGYRARRTEGRRLGPVLVACESRGDRLELTAEASAAALDLDSKPLRVGLTAVLQSADGALAYWALAHPEPKPDFHGSASRTLRLEPPPTAW